MPLFDINSHEIHLITNYLYKDLQNLKTKDNSPFKFNVDDILNQNTILNKHNYISLGYGKYIYNYQGYEFLIDYKEEYTPKACYGEPQYFIRLIIEADSKEKFLEFFFKVCSEEKKEEGKTDIMVCNKYGEWRNYSKIPSRTLKSIYLDESIKNRIKDDISSFLSCEEEYDKFGIPYKKTYLITGVPGSGKTSLIKALCNEFNYNLAIFSTKEISNNNLINAFQNIGDKTAILFEDFDCMFEKRKSTGENPSLSFSNILNIFDGVLFKHGLIVFITTNHPENLDKALIRPGRIDLILNFNYPSKDDICKLFNDLMNKYYNGDELIKNFNNFYEIIKNKKLTMSAIVNFLFIYRDKYAENIKFLLDTDSFIKSITKEDTERNLYN